MKACVFSVGRHRTYQAILARLIGLSQILPRAMKAALPFGQNYESLQVGRFPNFHSYRICFNHFKPVVSTDKATSYSP